MIKIYSDRAFLPKGQQYYPLFYPFWGAIEENTSDPDAGIFKYYSDIAHNYFKIVSLEECDIAISPGEWQSGDRNILIRVIAEEAKRHGKLIVIFFNNDSDEIIDIENAIVFRTSFYKSLRKEREYALPGWSEDFIEHYYDGLLQIRKKKSKPVVGYCGYTNFNRKGIGKLKFSFDLIFRPNHLRPGERVRSRAVQGLMKSREIETNFIIRDKFWGGAFDPQQRNNINYVKQLRVEYVHNIINSDYILCARGGGNFSYRLYEILSCGRIPAFVNTDCVLPFDHMIDWRKHSVWIEEKDLPRIGKIVRRFHDALTPETFEEYQLSCRKLWEEWICPQGFFIALERYLRNLLSNPQ